MSLFFSSVSLAAIPKPSPWVDQVGGLRGGRAGSGFSLLEVKRQTFAQVGAERIIVAQGNATAGRHVGAPGYFTVDIKKDRVTIDFAQTLNTRFQTRELQRAFANSKFVKSARMYFEPQSQTTSFVLQLKEPVQFRAIPYAGSANNTALVAFEMRAVPKQSKK